MASIQHEKTLVKALPVNNQPIRIAQLAPLYESVPPRLYGGTERIVSYLSEELVRRGHKVTLFAAGDSTAKVPLAAGAPRSLRLTGLDHLGPVFHLPMLSSVYDHAQDFDVIHSHVDCLSFPFARLAQVPMVSTMHGRLDLPELLPVYRSYRGWKPMVSISWKSTTQKFHSISDLVGAFETEGEAVAFAAQAGKAWVDSQTPVPAADAVKNTPRRRSRKSAGISNAAVPFNQIIQAKGIN